MDLVTNPVVKSFLAGSLSGTCSTILFQPLDLVKTRLQQNIVATSSADVACMTSPAQSVRMIHVVQNVLRNEHVLGLWRGILPSITRTVPGVGLYFGSLHWLKTHVTEKPSPLQAICMGMVARSFSGCLMIPITVVKTRFESNAYNYTKMSTALRQIYSKEGVRGLACGLVPTLVRDAPFSGLYLMFYTQLKQHVLPHVVVSPNSSSADSKSAANFCCGLVAGFLASTVTHPADVIKTKMQLKPDVYKNVVVTTKHVLVSAGPRGLLVGLMPRMIRRTLMSALAWTVYEEIMRRIGLKNK